MTNEQIETFLGEVNNLFQTYEDMYGVQPKFLIMDIDTCLDFEEALEITFGIPKREFKPTDKAKRSYRGCEIIPAFLNERRVILA